MNKDRIQRIDKIESGNSYEGYIWMSDKQNPIVIEGEFGGVSLIDGENPFIIEANLFDKEHGISYSVKYVDGSYMAMQYQVEGCDFNSTKVDQKTYFANRMEDKTLHFLRYWKEEKDEFCEGQPVLRPEALVFVGFKEKEENV